MAAKKNKPPPFNYCDYRCERCDERENCRVFKENQERIMDHYLRGEDPYNPDVFMKDLHDIFANTNNMVIRMAEDRGIDISDATSQEAAEVNPEDYVVYRLAHTYFEEAHAFIKELEETGVTDAIREDFEDLVWYHTLIVAKTGRLVSGFMDDFLDEELQTMEEEGTIGVIQKGITASSEALHHMLNELPEQLYAISDLIDMLKRLDKQLQADIRQKVVPDQK
jgi:hypothetical protein